MAEDATFLDNLSQAEDDIIAVGRETGAHIDMIPDSWIKREGESRGAFRARRRKNTKGKDGIPKRGGVYLVMEVECDGWVVDVDDKPLVAGVAQAAVAELKAGFAAISQKVKQGTQEWRASAFRNLQGQALERLAKDGGQAAKRKFKSWAGKRFSGGRIGLMMPDPSSDSFWTNSGRFIASLAASITGVNPVRATINVAGNRLDPSTFRPGELEALLERVRFLVPVLNPRNLFSTPSVRAAVQTALGAMNARDEQELAAARQGLAQGIAAFERGIAAGVASLDAARARLRSEWLNVGKRVAGML